MTKRFGQLLSEGIKSVASRNEWKIGDIQKQIADELGYSHHAVQSWREGTLPRDVILIVGFIVRYCVQNGRLDRTWANSILAQAKHPERETLLQELFSTTSPLINKTPRICQNLPPLYGEFLGREADLSRVVKGLVSRWPLISIEGLAGNGKTTLAVKTAQRCLSDLKDEFPQPFQAVVWISAKDRPGQKHWLNEVLDTIARILDYRYIIQLEQDEKIREIDNLLRSQQVLLIIDNFETIEDTQLEQWLQRLPEPSKAILTTRQSQMRSVWPIHLAGLRETEAVTLIRRHTQRLGLRHLEKQDTATLSPLARVTQGNPKAIEMALGYIKRGMLSFEKVVNHLHTASVTVNDIFAYLFTQAWELLDKDARHLLMASAFFIDTASKEALATVADLQGYRLDTALGQLTDLSLLSITRETERYNIHPLTRAFANRQCQTQPEWESVGRKRWLTWHRQLAKQALNSANFVRLENEVLNLTHVMEWLLTQKLMNELSWFFRHLQRLLYSEGYWTPFLHFAGKILSWAEASDERKLFRQTLHHLINILRRQSARKFGEQWLTLAQKFADRTGDERLQAETWLGRGRLWYETGLNQLETLNKAQQFPEAESGIIVASFS